jgi:acetyl-CoA carboxylase carboxyl transferase subunit alpha
MILEVEKPLLELEEKINELKEVNLKGTLDLSREIEALERKAEKLKRSIYEGLSPWDRVQLARHPNRPTTLDYVREVFTDFMELHGDRLMADDAAIVGGFARLEGEACLVIGHQRGKDTKENLLRNFGLPNPSGFRKAGRLMTLADRYHRPIFCFIDTKGANPGIEAEEKGQYEAIAQNIALMLGLRVPIVVTVIGEGGSGGALAIGVGDRVLMLENSVYSVISPEGCATILWRDAGKARDAAQALCITARDLLRLRVIDEIVPEPMGGAHREPSQVFSQFKDVLLRQYRELSGMDGDGLLAARYHRYRQMGHLEIT